MGSTGYYCQFILKFKEVAQPLHELTLGENAGKKRLPSGGTAGANRPSLT